MKNYRSVLKHSFYSALLCGLGYFGYQIHATVKILNGALDTTDIDRFENKLKKSSNASNYICLPLYHPEKSSSPIDRFWDSITFSYARRLLNLAQSELRDIRLRAIRSLASIKYLDDWHYSLLAHMCDARTAIGLARSKNIDLRFFVDPPHRFIFANQIGTIKWMKSFLISLNDNCEHPCLSYFIKKNFINVREVGYTVEHDITPTDVTKCIQFKKELLPDCVESILHHSTIGDNAKDIVQLDGLPLLMEVYKQYKEDREVVIALIKIIANASIHPELIQDIFKSGWVGVLASSLKSEDIRISGPAAKTLANLDIDGNLNGKFERKVYLLYPAHRTTEKQDMDIILVHGLLGGVFFTWRQRDVIKPDHTYGILGKKGKTEEIETITSAQDHKIKPTSDPSTREYIAEVEERKKLEWDNILKDYEIVFHDLPKQINGDLVSSCSGDKCRDEETDYTQCWPKDWLPKDCPNLRIVGINYNSNLSMWSPMCPMEKHSHNTMATRSEEFLEKLVKVGIGNRPIVWITHSMGGLLVKNMLIQAWSSADKNIRKICDSTKGVVFYSTPHRGSHAASLNQTTSLFLWPSVEVRELKEGSPPLLQLHEQFLSLLKRKDIKIVSFVETESTIISPLKFNIHFVRCASAKMNVGEYYEIPLDHLRICKPVSRYSFLYQKVLEFIKEITEEKERAKNDNI